MLQVSLCLAAMSACSQDRSLSRTKLAPEAVRDGERREPRAPGIRDGAGKDALREYVQACYGTGLGYNPAFRRGGAVVIKWFGPAAE